MRALGDTITQLRTESDVDSTTIGLVGVSAGAALPLHCAQIDSRVQAVVDYFGVYRMRDPEYASKLPPVLIVGGEATRLDAMLTKYMCRTAPEGNFGERPARGSSRTGRRVGAWRPVR